jgi:hypothetical protein
VPELVEALLGRGTHEAPRGGGGRPRADVLGPAVALDQVADDPVASSPRRLEVAGAVGRGRVRVVDDERPPGLEELRDQRRLARAGAEDVEAHVLVGGGEALAVQRRLAAALDPAENDRLHPSIVPGEIPMRVRLRRHRQRG